MRAVVEDWEAVRLELGGTAKLFEDKQGRTRIGDALTVSSLDNAELRAQAFVWLRERVNTFVNTMRPRVRSVVLDLQ